RRTYDLVTRALVERNPVGYRMDFLGAYQPNASAYLSPEIRKRLRGVGKVGVSGQPAGTYTRQLLDRLLIDLSWNSSRLEGNTYSLLETQRLLEIGETAQGKGAFEAQMILNHKAAIELITGQGEEVCFNRYTICNLHALLSDNLLPDPAACGRVRSRGVGISGTVFQPLENPHAIDSELNKVLEKASAIEDPFEQAFFVMVHLPYLQPFEDVNKRVSRLAANIPLIRHDLCPLSFVDVPQADYVSGLIGIYELNRVDLLRDVFVWAYERSALRYTAIRQSLGEPDPFRFRHRTQIGTLVQEIVQAGLNRKKATDHMRAWAVRNVPPQDQPRFLEVIETELDSLHEGNFARYRIRPSEFDVWNKRWK
ncbi:MAG: Fic family protein, partial [Planctomycetes bacterium]|nr:Fic family protein [Planctomycetota bacterium]